MALAHLRVCTANRAGAANCGTCRKCVRTMAMLAAAPFGRLLPAEDAAARMPRFGTPWAR